MSAKSDKGTSRAQHMNEPLKKHGDKVDLGRLGGPAEQAEPQTGGAGERQTTPLEPEEQGGVGRP